MLRILVTIFVLCTGLWSQQLWSGFIDPSRAIDWTHAGAVIPTTFKQCGVTIPAYSGSAATINSAIAACPANHYVQLGAGAFTLSSMIDWASKSNVFLRGAGSNRTILVFSAAVTGPSCGRGFEGAAICQMSHNHGDGSDDSYDNEVSWTAGYSIGTTSITINTFTRGVITNIQVGSLVFLDQQDDNLPPATDVVVCQIANFCSSSASSSNCRSQNHRLTRPASQCEPQTVTSITGTGPWTIGISPGVRMPNVSNTKNPTLWSNTGLPIKNVGVEDLTVDLRLANTFIGLMWLDCYNCWTKGVAFVGPSTWPDGIHNIWSYQSKNTTVRDGYFFGGTGGSDAYAISNFASADNLFENNISQHMAFSDMMEGCIGCVQTYNFAIDDLYTANGGAPEWQQASSYHHSVGDAFVLVEGNQGIGLTGDDVHGTSNMWTALRNYWIGRDPNGGGLPGIGKTFQTNAVIIYSYSRFWNLLGNVMGDSAYHNAYQQTSSIANSHSGDCASNCQTSIFMLGFSGNGGTYQGAVKNDLLTWQSLLRWGNWDTVTNAVRWCGSNTNTGWVTRCGSVSEVPTGLSLYSTPIPSTETVPNSFFYASKPSWWPNGIPWPATGPEVTGGNVPNAGGHANYNPAANCYLFMMHGVTDGSGSVLPFDSKLCYNPQAPIAPAPMFASIWALREKHEK